MADYKTLYFHLFNALTDVLLALEENNVDLAIKQIKTFNVLQKKCISPNKIGRCLTCSVLFYSQN